MPWLKLDDRILDHPKFVRAERLSGSTAFHLWVGLMSYAKQHRTDGWVPLDMLSRVNGPRARWRARALDALLEVVLVERHGERLLIHDFLDWNPSRYEIEHPTKTISNPPNRPTDIGLSVESAHGERKVSAGSAQSERRVSVKSALRDSKKNGQIGLARLRAGSESESESESESDPDPPEIPPSVPSPAAPPPTKKKSSNSKGNRVCPADFKPTDAVLQLATELGFSNALELKTRASMIDWSIGKAALRADWQATYRNWLRKTADERGLKPVKHDAQWRSYQTDLRKANEAPAEVAAPPPAIEQKVRTLFA